MSLFTPHREGARAEWRVLYDEVARLAYGDELTYDQIAELLGTRDRDRAYRAVRGCNEHLVRDGRPRVLGSVRGRGYRVLPPAEYAPPPARPPPGAGRGRHHTHRAAGRT
jgi:hypothetical protein